jgi:hypothetical protein
LGLALLELNRASEAVPAFTGALTAADALLALTDSNVAAIQARALALSGLAAATGDPAHATEAVQVFARARALASAIGVTADTRRLLKMIAAHDRTGVLPELRAALDI